VKAIGIEVKIQNQPRQCSSPARARQRIRASSARTTSTCTHRQPSIDPHTTMLSLPQQAHPDAGRLRRRELHALQEPSRRHGDRRAGSTLDLRSARLPTLPALKALNDAYVIIWLYDRANIDARVNALQGWEPNVWRRFTWNMESWWMKK